MRARTLPLGLVLVLALVVVACDAAPVPPPDSSTAAPSPGTATDRPDDGMPAPTVPADATDTTAQAAADVLEPVAQPLLPGLYLPQGMLARGTDHYLLLQSRVGCDVLASILGAGEWSIDSRLDWPLPTPNAAEGIPELPSTEWLLLRWGSETAIARIGGNEGSCAAQVWRVSRQPFSAGGAIEAAGDASAVQATCMAAEGMASVNMLYIGPDDFRYTVQTEVPLQVGTHSIGADTEVTVGRSQLGLFDLFQLFASPEASDFEDEGSLRAFIPGEDHEEWPGSVTVTSVEPLVGEIDFPDLRDEQGQSQSLRTGFRCDLPPGQLARAAAEEPAPVETLEPEPVPAGVGTATVRIDTGRHAGSHQVTSENVTCSHNLFSDDMWNAGFYPDDQTRAGELQTLNVDVPEGGGRTSVMMTFGDDFDDDWFNTDDARGEVTDGGDVVEFRVRGRSASGVDFEIDLVCYDVARF